ncbi:lanthionine synthetase LanC family protein [Dyadobacter crusticola]|uniref:lanthionine synthetase LanC family protein n=1 Tax=Dyadobacter crusticola TaxID=292407 RepID=UPI0004E20FA1|nr:lanthionine synthetase LanC family protein [Dyadobacter crusticola]
MQTIQEDKLTSRIKDQIPALTALITENPTPNANVSRGELGTILYFFYLSRATGEEHWRTEGFIRLQEMLKRITDNSVAEMMNPTLASGLSGLGMALEVLINEGFIADQYVDFLDRLDQYVFEHSHKKILKGNTDFLHGGTGGFHYLYYRLERNPHVHAYLVQYVRSLPDITQPFGEGAFFRNAYIANISRPGEVNLGLSHGMAATILVLLNLYEAGIEKELTESLIRKYIGFIIHHKNTGEYEPGKHAMFPNTVIVNDQGQSEPDGGSYQGGLRWCYGDMNVSHLLYKASALLDEPHWYDLATETGLASLAITDFTHARCHGSLFCHGATGIAHYYDYLGRISGLDDYRSGYRYWMKAAFAEFERERAAGLYTDISSFFLEGSVGSGLVLMNALLDEPGYWEKIWLLS